MRVRDVMTSPAYCVSADDTVTHAAAEMLGRGVPTLPVVDRAGRLRGLVADGALRDARPDLRISEVLEAHPYSVTPTTDALEAARRLVGLGAKAAPVVEKDRVVGLVALHDLMRELGPRAKDALRERS